MLNLGILAHIDAGKTSLTERLLHAAGVIDDIGSVDEGSTRTDSLALERQRGITIKSAVVSFTVDDTTVNLIDTPGHPDFIAEVERVLNVLDAAVLVVSAVEGVQAQTRGLMRTLQRLRIPTLAFVNKIDRAGAGDDTFLDEISPRLSPAIVAMGAVGGLGTRGASVTPYGLADPPFTTSLLDLLAGHDDALLEAYVNADTVPFGRLHAALAAQTRRPLVHPVFFGSAITGAGLADLTAAIPVLLPAAEGDAGADPAGTVFKVERGPGGEQVAYVRMFAGAVRVREKLRVRQQDSKVTAIEVFDRGGAVPRSCVVAGEIGRLRGLGDIRIGDPIGAPRPADQRYFAPPTLSTVVVPVNAADRGALHVALTQLTEQDPLINLRVDGIRQEISLSLYGEVQKEVIQATLADGYGVDAVFRETTTICVERLVGTGRAVELIGRETNPLLGTVGLRVAPGPPGSGVTFGLEVEIGSMPLAFVKAVEETVRGTLREGLHGWEVVDCAVALTHCGYWARQSHAHGTFDKSMSSTAGDFRNLPPLVLMDALARAGPRVLEPMHRFRLELPADLYGVML